MDNEQTVDIQAIVDQWGEAFVDLATDPRFIFEGDRIGIRLWKPIKSRGEPVDVLWLTEPTLDDLQKLDSVRGQIAQTRRLIVSCCGITEKDAGAIGMRDLAQISKLTVAFTDAAQGTGATR